MYDIISLDGKELPEIKEIARQLDIPKVDRLTKQELIYKILDFQALNPPQDILEQEKKSVKKPFRPRRQRTQVKPKFPQPHPAEPMSKAVFPEEKKPVAIDDLDMALNDNDPIMFDESAEKLFTEPEFSKADEPLAPEEEIVGIVEPESETESEPQPEPELEPGREPVVIVGNGDQPVQEERRPREPHRKFPEKHRDEYTFEFEGIIISDGVLEIMTDGYAFLRSSDYN